MFLFLAITAVAGLGPPLMGRRTALEAVSTPTLATMSTPTLKKALVDVPLRRLRLPKGGFGRDYVLVEIQVDGSREEFLLDTGLSLELVTPALRERLHLASGEKVEGSTAGGTTNYEVVELRDAKVGDIPLPPLHATIADFPMEHIDKQHDVTGMLGLEFVRLFDVELDCLKNRFRLWRRGDGVERARRTDMIEIPALFDGSVLAVRVVGNPRRHSDEPHQPFLGIVDSGASLTVLTTEAARLAGLEVVPGSGPSILGVGVDGRPLQMPIVSNVHLELTGDPVAGRFPTLAGLPTNLQVAVGDLPVFIDLLGEQRGKAAAVLGMDFWAQGRTLFLGSDSSGPTSIFWSSS